MAISSSRQCSPKPIVTCAWCGKRSSDRSCAYSRLTTRISTSRQVRQRYRVRPAGQRLDPKLESRAHDGSQDQGRHICINTHNYGDPAWPFGGYKQSGWGREMGKEVMENYTETKSVAMNLG